MPFKRRKKAPRDWFICPVCGAEVPVGASFCRECGSDETTGWSEATAYDDLDLPEPDPPLIPDTFEEFVSGGGSKVLTRPSLALVIALVAAFLIVTLLFL